ncbi:hypothetical protein IWQ49_006311 [Labrenzia sp. EL_126]|nr:hypothetical protein [Labrenzia sp. EL_126]
MGIFVNGVPVHSKAKILRKLLDRKRLKGVSSLPLACRCPTSYELRADCCANWKLSFEKD